jgi:Cft2 family RNA processing exonuclease
MKNKYIERGYKLKQLKILKKDLLEEIDELFDLALGDYDDLSDFQKECEIIKRNGEDYFEQAERRYDELDLIDDAKQALE